MVSNFTYLNDIIKLIVKYHNKNEALQIMGDLMGARWSGKTKSEERFMLKLAHVLNELNIKGRIVWFRYEVSGAQEQFDEVLDLCEEFGITDINKSKRLIRVGKIEIQFYGFKSNTSKKVSKLGLKRTDDLDVLVRIIDEIYEFKDNSEISQIDQALGGGRITVKLHSTNPFSKFQWKIAELDKKIAIDKEIMDTKGYMFQDKWTKKELTMTNPLTKKEETSIVDTYEFIHWSNHRVNEFLSATEHQELLDIWKTDPNLAKVVERGEMGMAEGGVYTDYLHKVPEKIYENYIPEYFYGGVDIGFTRDATAAYILEKDRFGRYVVRNEFYYSPIEKQQDYTINGDKFPWKKYNVDEQARLIANWYQNLFNKLQDSDMPYYMPTSFKIKVDHQATFNDLINKYIRNNGMVAENAFKVPINRRIAAFQYLMANGRLFIDKDKCPKLWAEMNMITYKENAEVSNGERIREDGNDHGINALEYAFGINTNIILKETKAKFYNK